MYVRELEIGFLRLDLQRARDDGLCDGATYDLRRNAVAWVVHRACYTRGVNLRIREYLTYVARKLLLNGALALG